MKNLFGLSLIIMAILMMSKPVYAAGPIVLDGLFNDWQGMPRIDDTAGDSNNKAEDLKAFYFGTNPGEARLYFMAERWYGGAPPINLALWIDTNNDRIFDSDQDRKIVIYYAPKMNQSFVDVSVYSGAGAFVSQVASDADWGEPKNPGTRVEWGISFADLGIYPGQTIRLALNSGGGRDRIPDSGDIQWSPADTLGKPILAAILLAGAVFLAKHKK